MKKHGSVFYWSTQWGFYIKNKEEQDDYAINLVSGIMQGVHLFEYDKMIAILAKEQAIFDNNVEGIERKGEKARFMLYLSDETIEYWFTYESVSRLFEEWKEVILYRPSAFQLHRSGEQVWLTFERPVGVEKALIKNSLKGYSVFVATPGSAECLAQFFVDEIMPLPVHSISRMRSSLQTSGKGRKFAWEVKDNTVKIFLSENPTLFCELTLNNLQSLMQQWMMYAHAQYFRIFLEYKDSQWNMHHSDSVLDEKYGYEL